MAYDNFIEEHPPWQRCSKIGLRPIHRGRGCSLHWLEEVETEKMR